MPNVQVSDLSYSTVTKQLVAATYGRGMFTYQLASPLAVLRGDVNRDGKVDAFDALLIQTALLGGALTGGLTPLPQGDTNCTSAEFIACFEAPLVSSASSATSVVNAVQMGRGLT